MECEGNSGVLLDIREKSAFPWCVGEGFPSVSGVYELLSVSATLWVTLNNTFAAARCD